MSWETQSWAAKQRPGSASAKLVLLGLASCADANHCAYPSIDWLVAFSDLNRKTVIAALDRLTEAALISDSGERRGRTRQVKVYRLTVTMANDDDALASDPAAETVPKAEPSQKRNGSGFGGKQSRNRDTEPFREPIPLSPPDGGDAPQGLFADRGDPVRGRGKRSAAAARATRLPVDWTPPPVADLPPLAQATVQQWPEGAYAVVCERFRLHWHSQGGARALKIDWLATLGKWIMTDHAGVMRDAKAGVRFSTTAGHGGGAMTDAELDRIYAPPRSVARQDAVSAAVHEALRREVPEHVYRRVFGPLAILCAPDGRVTVIARVHSFIDQVETGDFRMALDRALRTGTGRRPTLVTFETESRRDRER